MKRKPWSRSDEQQLRTMHAAGVAVRDIAQALGRDRSVIKARAKASGLRFGYLRHPFTAAEDELLRRRYADERTEDIANDIGRTEGAVYQRATRLGLRKSQSCIARMSSERARQPDHGGRRTRFQKGLVPANKGLRRPGWAPGRMSETQFKKGRPAHEARNYVPIGSHRISKDGYLERKVTDDPSTFPTRRWASVHRLVWEAANGPVPAGHAVVFLPGRRTAEEALITLDALELISRVELMRRNSYHNRYPKEVGLAIQLRGQIIRQINKRTRREKQD